MVDMKKLSDTWRKAANEHFGESSSINPKAAVKEKLEKLKSKKIVDRSSQVSFEDETYDNKKREEKDVKQENDKSDFKPKKGKSTILASSAYSEYTDGRVNSGKARIKAKVTKATGTNDTQIFDKLHLGYNQIYIGKYNRILPLLLTDVYIGPNLPEIITAIEHQTYRIYSSSDPDARKNAISVMMLDNDLNNLFQRTWALFFLELLGVPLTFEPFQYTYIKDDVVLDDDDRRLILAMKYAIHSAEEIDSYTTEQIAVSTRQVIIDISYEVESIIMDIRNRITGDLYNLNAFITYQQMKATGLSTYRTSVDTIDLDFALNGHGTYTYVESNSTIRAGYELYQTFLQYIPKVAIKRDLAYRDDSAVVGTII